MAGLRTVSRVLVTGASGCVGRHVLPRLVDAGWDVHGVTSRKQPPAVNGLSWHTTDLLHTSGVEALLARVRPTHLLHLAWYVAPGKWPSAPENLQWVEATLALLRAFQTHGGERVVTAGTCLEYDWNFGYCAESRTPLHPHTVYGSCKHALQTLTAARAAATGLSSAWGRIFFLYGPHEHPDRLIASVIRSLLAGEPARCSHGTQIRDYLFVQDVADAFVALLENEVTGAVNIGSGQPVALKEIVARVGTLLQRSELIRLGAIPGAATDTPLVVADMTHTFRSMDWRPRTSMDEGLTKTIDWWQQRIAQETRP